MRTQKTYNPVTQKQARQYFWSISSRWMESKSKILWYEHLLDIPSVAAVCYPNHVMSSLRTIHLWGKVQVHWRERERERENRTRKRNGDGHIKSIDLVTGKERRMESKESRLKERGERRREGKELENTQLCREAKACGCLLMICPSAVCLGVNVSKFRTRRNLCVYVSAKAAKIWLGNWKPQLFSNGRCNQLYNWWWVISCAAYTRAT